MTPVKTFGWIKSSTKVSKMALQSFFSAGAAAIQIRQLDTCDISSKVWISKKKFYVTMYSNAPKEVFPDNSLTAFTIHLAHPINLGSASDWEVGLAEVPYKAPNRQILQGTVVDFVSSIKVLFYCDLITPHFVGSDNVRLLRTIICPTQLGNHLLQNVYNLPVEKSLFQDIRIELRVLYGEHAAFENSVIPRKVVLHFRRV